MNTFFIAGVQRSGTTLLSVLLSKHPDILMERRSIAFRIITSFDNLYDLLPFNLNEDKNDFLEWLIENDLDGRLANLLKGEELKNSSNIRDLIQKSIDLKLEKENKQLWGDKSPNLEHFLKDIRFLMPQCKILHIVRDGRAVAYSMSTRSSRNLLLSAQKWFEGNIRGLVNQDIIGKEYYKIIRYEDLISKPELVMRSVCEFLNIDFHSAILNPDDDQIPEDKKYVKSTFDKSKLDKWKVQLSKKEIFKIEKIQGPLLKRLGYQLDTPENLFRHQPLSVWSAIRYNQADNFRQLFRSKRIGMVDREQVEINIPIKNRIYAFLRVLSQDFVSASMFKTLFSRVFYKKKYYQKKESPFKKRETIKQ